MKVSVLASGIKRLSYGRHGLLPINTAYYFKSSVRQQEALSPKTVEIVKATAPVVAEHGYKITTTMYKKMFAENSAVRELFNQTHQVILPGDTKAKQPWSLACSVHAYAANIDNLEVLHEAVERIAQKHASLYVLPEHYPIVGENLLWAMKEVLGDAATPEIMQAWKEAYLFLADILIKREIDIREKMAHVKGGWEGWRTFVVDQKILESSELASFYLRPKDGGPIADFSPGQYTAIRVETPQFTTQRNYSLSLAPGHSYYRITVKRAMPMVEGAPKGLVSNWLHDNVNVGDELKLGIPCGDFVLKFDQSKPLVLLAGGVGLTPMFSMLEYLIESGYKSKIIMVNTVRSPSVEGMHDLLVKYSQKHLNVSIKTVYDDGPIDYPKGPITMEQLDEALITRDCNYFFCGPEGFMKTIYKGLKKWNIPQDQIHFEFFGPHDDLLK